MSALKRFIRKSFLGGLLVVLPATILLVVFRWIFNTVEQLIEPLSLPLAQRLDAPEFLIDLLVIAMILLGCFLIGTLALTGLGKWLHIRFDSSLAKLAPGYNLVRDIIHQLFGDNANSPFKQGDVARVKLFGPNIPTEATAIITSKHKTGWFSVFVPTGPNPTSGLIYHLPPEQVEIMVGVKVDEAFKTIIACGAGSSELFERSSRTA